MTTTAEVMAVAEYVLTTGELAYSPTDFEP